MTGQHFIRAPVWTAAWQHCNAWVEEDSVVWTAAWQHCNAWVEEDSVV